VPASPPVHGSHYVDHYKCYEVRRGAALRVKVILTDRFGPRSFTVRAPQRLCIPVAKNGEGILPLPGPRHLLCYAIRPRTPHRQDVFVANQFGPGALTVRRDQELCVPCSFNPDP
jgi:hypothetical protein